MAGTHQWAIRILAIFGLAIEGGKAAAAPEIQDLAHAALADDPSTILTPEQLAAGIVKNADAGISWDREFGYNGLDRDHADALIAITGNPPGPGELLNGWRRGFIDRGQVERGVRQGYLKDEWWEALYAKLFYEELPVSEAIRGAVQNHLDYNAAEEIAGKQGVTGAAFRTMFENAGRPPGPEQMIELWRRGFMDEAQVRQGIRESDIKDKYVDKIVGLYEYVPPPRTVTTLLRHGAISPERAQELFRKNGLSAQDAAAYATSAQALAPSAHHALTVANVRSLYEDRIIDRATAVADIVKLGWTETDASLLVDLADAMVEQKYRNTAISKVHAMFIGRHIEEQHVLGLLDAIPISSQQRDHLLKLWKLEVDATVKVLTIGQLNSAYKKGVIDEAAFTTRAMQLGYREADAAILAAIDIPPADIPISGPHSTQFG